MGAFLGGGVVFAPNTGCILMTTAEQQRQLGTQEWCFGTVCYWFLCLRLCVESFISLNPHLHTQLESIYVISILQAGNLRLPKLLHEKEAESGLEPRSFQLGLDYISFSYCQMTWDFSSIF